MRLLPLLAATSVACVFSGPPGSSGGDAGTEADASTDGVGIRIDATPCELLWAPEHVDPCDPAPLNDALVIDSDATFDTDNGELTVNGVAVAVDTVILDDLDPDVRVLFVESLDIQSGTFSITGSMPLLLASNTTAAIDGVLSVAADHATAAAGSRTAAQCPGGAAVGEDDSGGSGGGGGGGYQGAGGTGGTGDANTGNPGEGGDGGEAAVAVADSPLGGCAGNNGGDGGNNELGVAGAGGGALQLSARTQIVVRGSGAIDAAGGGGSGARGNDSGGGGGGSGGYIHLDAPDIDVIDQASVTANGGGGGGGSTGGAGDDGSDGDNGTRDASRAAGGDASNGGASDGADGGAGTNSDGDSQDNGVNGGAGGGGGGVGYVIVPTANLELGVTAFISPDPTEPP